MKSRSRIFPQLISPSLFQQLDKGRWELAQLSDPIMPIVNKAIPPRAILLSKERASANVTHTVSKITEYAISWHLFILALPSALKLSAKEVLVKLESRSVASRSFQESLPHRCEACLSMVLSRSFSNGHQTTFYL